MAADQSNLLSVDAVVLLALFLQLLALLFVLQPLALLNLDTQAQ